MTTTERWIEKRRAIVEQIGRALPLGEFRIMDAYQAVRTAPVKPTLYEVVCALGDYNYRELVPGVRFEHTPSGPCRLVRVEGVTK